MAKVTGPLMSIDDSGAFADTIIYAKWKGINYSRQYAIPEIPRQPISFRSGTASPRR